MRSLALLTVLFCCLAVAPGCQSVQRSPDEVVLWTGFENELPTLIKLADDFSRQSGKRVRIVKVPFQSLQNKYLIAAPAGQGPDLLIGPQDWVGVLRTAGMIEPVPAGVVAQPKDFMPVTLTAMTFEGQLYAVPLVAQCVALIRNPQLVATSPHNLEELISLAKQAQVGDHYGFYYGLKDLYFSWPFFATEGAYLFGTTPDGKLDPANLGLDNPGAVKAGEYLRRLTAENVMPPDASNDLARSLYLEGRAGMILNGPWFLKELRTAKVPYVIEPVPGVADQPAPCLVTVEGVMLNNRAVAREPAVAFMKFLALPESQEQIALASGRPPASLEALARAGKDPVVGPDLLAFARVVDFGVPMPNHPAVSAVWEDMSQAVELITKGEPAGDQLRLTRERVSKRIKQMME